MVEYARTFLMSHCFRAMVAANSAVNAPTPAHTVCDTGASENSPWKLDTRYTPAVTSVAAWISADTGVGPAIASGSHVYRGICADLPVHPRNRNSVIAVTTPPPATSVVLDRVKTSVKSSETKCWNRINIATRKPKSPMRLTMNAFLPASAFAFSVNQNPINRYEQSPTPSQPTNITGKLAPSTNTSSKKTNKFRYAK